MNNPDPTQSVLEGRKIRILHLEDDPLDAELAAAALERAGIPVEVTRVQTAAELKAALEASEFDIMLADYRLPGYNGTAALTYVLQHCPRLPVIFLSGTMGEDAAIEGLTRGATDYVLKSKLSRLVPAVRRALIEAENYRAREHAETALKEREQHFRQVFDNVSDALYLVERTDDGLFRSLEANPALARSLGLEREQAMGKLIEEIASQDLAQAANDLFRRCVETGVVMEQEGEFPLPIGRRTFLSTLIPVRDQAGQIHRIVGIGRDITDLRQHEAEREAMIRVADAIRSAAGRSEILNLILDQLIELFHADAAMFASLDPATGEAVMECGRGSVGSLFTGRRVPAGRGISHSVIVDNATYISNNAGADPRLHYRELLGEARSAACVPVLEEDRAIGALWLARIDPLSETDARLLEAIASLAANAIHRVTLLERTEQQLQRLISLHHIDVAISSSLDLNITLNVLLNSVRRQLGVDAADVLLLRPYGDTLEYAAGVGFDSHVIEHALVQLGSGQAGLAAQERRILSLPDIAGAAEQFNRPALLAEEHFVSHCVAPLVARGQLKGVLEVFTRRRLEPSRDWLEFMEMLATLAAIAIDSAALFDNLQRSNTDLKLAYDATIEGWSRALDLRDRETEGHTQRVTEMSLRLASRMGVMGADLMNLRRGALLHDIGKMGVPDSILLKPAPLTEEEWAVMRRHPDLAYEMLAPISYLSGAIDIPYCHHEKWDGSGYPRGLQGDRIPLPARIFAVVDVWDALRSARPYRDAWTKDAALQYIRQQAGKHFDHQVLSAFMAEFRGL